MPSQLPKWPSWMFQWNTMPWIGQVWKKHLCDHNSLQSLWLQPSPHGRLSKSRFCSSWNATCAWWLGRMGYIDDIEIFDTTGEDHVTYLREVLLCLENAGFTINPLKCEFAVKETDWLGLWLTPTPGVKPWQKKIAAIQALAPPTNCTQLHAFNGSWTYYNNMWPKHAQIMAPLTQLAGSSQPWNRTDDCQHGFEQMKALIAEDTLLCYPDPQLPAICHLLGKGKRQH